ncbi:DUF1819 family protein [Nocardia sp. NPDC052112]|uniref:DUF1819 family protein n=1 Tax=Nocardia sp. NPDC052112 TaxID=3155646 RepID=UPI003412EB91
MPRVITAPSKSSCSSLPALKVRAPSVRRTDLPFWTIGQLTSAFGIGYSVHRTTHADRRSHVPDAAYRLSFTTGGLLRAEATAIADLMLTMSDTDAVRRKAVSTNVVQQRTASSTERVTREVLQRLTELPKSGVEMLAQGPVEDGRHLMWLAACVRYQFLRDFGREVLRERPVVTSGDFDTFWNVQSSWVDGLRDTKPTTRNKLRQNTFRMLREAGYIDADGRVHPAQPSPAVADVIQTVSPELFTSFPMDVVQIATLVRNGRVGFS